MDISSDQILLFNNRKKLPLPVSDNSLDGIGTDLLSQDFLKVASNGNVMSQNENEINAEPNFSDPLLIMNNDLTGQQHITLDDVADLDLATLVNADVGPQLPQESLGFNDFLSENSFCLNGLPTTVKLSENSNKINYDNFPALSSSMNEQRGSKEFKIVPHYVDGKLSNTLHLAPVDSETKIPSDRISVGIFPSVPNRPSSQSDPNERITATIEDFPSLTSIDSTGINLSSSNLSAPVNNGVEKTDLKPKDTKKLKRKKTTKIISGGRKKKTKTTVIPSDAVSGTNSNLATTSTESKEPIKNVMPRFKIVHTTSDIPALTNVITAVEPQKIAPSTTVETMAPPTTTPTTFKDGTIIGTLNASPAIPLSQNFNNQQPVDLILPVVSVRSLGSDKPILKPISELKAEDVCTVRRDPLKKLSTIQLQQIVNYLKQRKTEKVSTSSNEKTKIICKIMYPDEFLRKNQLNKPASEPVATVVSIAKVEETIPNVEENSIKLKKPKMRVRERDYRDEEEYLPEIPMATSITRSGRTSRPPKKLVKLNGTPTTVNDPKNEQSSTEESTSVNGPHPSASTETNGDSDKPQLVDGLPTAKKKKNTLKYCCPTCGKSYMTNKGFLDHLTKFPLHAEKEFTMKILNEVENDSKKVVNPDRKKKKCKCKCKSPEHCKARRFHFKQLVDMASEKEFISACSPRFAKSTSLWDFFLLRINSLYKFEDYVKALLSELGKLVESLKTISAKILYLSHETSEEAVDIQDDTVAQIMGVAKGRYQTYPEGLNIKELKESSDGAEMFFDKPSESTNFHQSSELDGLAQPDGKEDISQSSILSDILCDKTGMDTVDQLVSERLKTLAPNDDILIDPPSDDLMSSLLDSVNAQSLSDAMFHSRVSGSTEDLLKALETLSSDIQPNHPPPTLDFTALSNEFNAPER